MSSARTTHTRRLLHRIAPWLFKKCPEGNFHWRWSQVCYCRMYEHCGPWHGGIYLFHDQREYQICLQCEMDRIGWSEPARKLYWDALHAIDVEIKTKAMPEQPDPKAD